MDYYGDLRRHGVTEVLRQIVHLAEERGKLPAFHETGVGIGRGYARVAADPDWYADLLDILKNDPVARRGAYVTTWYNKPRQYWVPYAEGVNGYEAFMQFYRDPYTAFSADVAEMALYAPDRDSTNTERRSSRKMADEQRSEETRKMQALLRPYLDTDYVPTEGPDQDKEFIRDCVERIRQALPARLTAPAASTRRVLVLTRDGYGALHVPGMGGLLTLLREAAQRYGAFALTELYSDEAIDAEMLESFDAVVLNNVGMAGRREVYNELLPAYVRNGGGLLAIHGSALLSMHHPDEEYNRMLGGFVDKSRVHPNEHGAPFPVRLPDPEHPLVAACGGDATAAEYTHRWLDHDVQQRKPFSVTINAPNELADELYVFHPKPNPDDSVRVLVGIAQPAWKRFPDGRSSFTYSVSWIKRYGDGRVYYTQLGHNMAVFSVPCVARALLDGLQYVAGDLQADARPLCEAAYAQEFVVEDEERFRRIVPRGSRLQTLADGMRFTEGPVWVSDKGGYLLFSDIPAGELKKWSPAAGVATARTQTHGGNGNALDSRGRVITCEGRARRVTLWEPDGEVKVLVDSFEGRRLNAPNDVVVKSDGSIWFTDPPFGLADEQKELDGNYVFRFDPADESLRIAADDLVLPNGLCFSPDETTLYVADTSRRNLRAYDVRDDGTLGEGRLFCKIDVRSPDGICCDSDGNIYSSAGDGVQIFGPDGGLIGRILLSRGASNVCFGGEEGKALFITAIGCLYRVELNATAVHGR